MIKMTNNTPSVALTSTHAACSSCACHSENALLRKKLAAYSSKACAKRERNIWFAGTLGVFGGLLWWTEHTAFERGDPLTGAAAIVGLPVVSFGKD
jgi:hypothetical protein